MAQRSMQMGMHTEKLSGKNQQRFFSPTEEENFLYPDQDNGFILADYPDADHNRIDAFFIALAARFTHDLDRGLPPLPVLPVSPHRCGSNRARAVVVKSSGGTASPVSTVARAAAARAADRWTSRRARRSRTPRAASASRPRRSTRPSGATAGSAARRAHRS